MSSIVGYKTDDTKTEAVDLSEAKFGNLLKLVDGQGAVVGAFTNDTIGTDAEDAYLKVDIGGTVYKIALWLDD